MSVFLVLIHIFWAVQRKVHLIRLAQGCARGTAVTEKQLSLKEPSSSTRGVPTMVHMVIPSSQGPAQSRWVQACVAIQGLSDTFVPCPLHPHDPKPSWRPSCPWLLTQG